MPHVAVPQIRRQRQQNNNEDSHFPTPSHGYEHDAESGKQGIFSIKHY